MDKTEDFLKRHMLAASSVDADQTLDFILSEMEKGLEEENGSSLLWFFLSERGILRLRRQTYPGVESLGYF